MPATPEQRARAGHTPLGHAADAVSHVILGKSNQVRLALTCLLAQGHLLIEDIPGVGKTMLAHALARALGLEFRRVQFTSDLLPADVLGASIYDRHTAQFNFHPGPVFSQVVLADEINRAPPKTQSALLEAMEERQVTLEGETRSLPEPFFVIATQNPREQAGTFPLPESQLDRFFMRIALGYPDADAERALLEGRDRRQMVAELTPAITPERLRSLQARVGEIHVAGPILDYIQGLLAASRAGDRFVTGLSPRAGRDVLTAARAWALVADRDYVLPEDVQAVFAAVVDHRLQGLENAPDQSPGAGLLEAVAVD